jgi:hypothetical protein
MPTAAPHRREERGAIAVEFAIAASLLVMLFFGILEIGMLLRSRSVITDASREGARVAAALPRTEGFQDNSLAAIIGVVNSQKTNPIDYVVLYRADPATGGHYAGQDIESCTDSCWRYEWKSGAFEQKLGATWDADSISACGGVSDTDWLGVYVRGHQTSVTGLVGGDRSFTDTTIMRFEPIALGIPCRP